jgi:hypothetical protein
VLSIGRGMAQLSILEETRAKNRMAMDTKTAVFVDTMAVNH